MNILHLEYAGKTGGIEKLCKDIGNASRIDHQYFYLFMRVKLYMMK